MKKISLIIPLLFLGCGTSVVQHNTPKQTSISTQKLSAQNAWDELDGKTIQAPKSTTSQKASVKSINITNQVKSMLETSDKIPDWFYSPPKSDKFFYGGGEGRNINEAKVNALNFIAGEIQTAVSSSFSKSQGYSNRNGQSDFYKSVKTKTRSEVKKINFTNIEIMKTIKVNNKIYLLVRIDKQKLFKNLKTQFEILDNKITSEITTSQKYSLLDQLITLNKEEKNIQKALSLINILSTLNPNFDVIKYTNKYNSFMSKKTDILHKLTFSVSSNDLFGQKLIAVLNEAGYKISSNSDIKISIQKQIRKSETYGMKIARVSVNIKVSANNKTLNSASIECKGVSNTYSQAIAKASQSFYKKVKKIGINKLLGFE